MVYKWNFSCQLGDGLCHRSHLLGEPETTIDFLEDHLPSREITDPLLTATLEVDELPFTKLGDVSFQEATPFAPLKVSHVGSWEGILYEGHDRKLNSDRGPHRSIHAREGCKTHRRFGGDLFLLGQWLNFKLFGITYSVGK